MARELGKTLDDAPDAWSHLSEAYVKPHHYCLTDESDISWSDIPQEYRNDGMPIKNFERWLFQRDRPGFETTPSTACQALCGQLVRCLF